MKKSFREELELKIKTGVPVIQIISYEWRRVYGFCASISKAENKQYFRWTIADGVTKFDPIDTKFDPENDMETPQEVLKWYQNDMPLDSILLMEDLHRYFEDNMVNRTLIGIIRSIARNSDDKKTLILSQPIHGLPVELEKEVYVMEIPLPSKELLLTVLNQVNDELELESGNIADEDKAKIAEAALGLTEFETRYTFKEIGIEFKKLTVEEVSLIIARKEQIIKKSGILEYFHPSESLVDVGGMDKLKEWLKNRRAGFESDAKEFGVTPPKGVLLLGIPGCGKSLIAKAFATQWDLPLLKFDLGKVFGGIVGESERNIRKALNIAQAIAPSILWIDEIEKGLSGVSSSDQSDAGTTARVFGTLLNWMQEKTEPVFVVATANNISQLPPELLRKGRFDEIFFVDLPGIESRKEIWKIHLKKRIKGRYQENMVDLNKLAKESIGYSGSEIEEAVNEALYRAYNDNRELTTQDLVNAFRDTYPLSKVMADTITNLRKWAKVRARFASDEKQEEISDDKKAPKLKSETQELIIFEE